MEYYSTSHIVDGQLIEQKGLYIDGLTHAKQASFNKMEAEPDIEAVILYGTDGSAHICYKGGKYERKN